MADFLASVVLLLAVCFTAKSQSNTGALPVNYTARVIVGSEQTCPPEEQQEIVRANIDQEINGLIRNTVLPTLDPSFCISSQDRPASSCQELFNCSPDLPSDYYWLTDANDPETAVQVYCDMDRVCGCSNASTAGGWARVAYLNMTDSTHQCPSPWVEITRTSDPRRTCGRADQTVSDCSVVTFTAHGLRYNRLCGRIVAYQLGITSGFQFSGVYNAIDRPFVAGVVLTYGTNPINHIWTFAAMLNKLDGDNFGCPCSDADNSFDYSQRIPPWVGENYFCDSGPDSVQSAGVFHADDPLWDGQGCGDINTCCEFNNPAYFCTQLPEATTDDIEMRLCQHSNPSNPPLTDIPIELIEIYIN